MNMFDVDVSVLQNYVKYYEDDSIHSLDNVPLYEKLLLLNNSSVLLEQTYNNLNKITTSKWHVMYTGKHHDVYIHDYYDTLVNVTWLTCCIDIHIITAFYIILIFELNLLRNTVFTTPVRK